jgi:hypothetical protein
MAAIYSNGGNRWNILGFNQEMRYLVYIIYLWAVHVSQHANVLLTVVGVQLHRQQNLCHVLYTKLCLLSF